MKIRFGKNDKIYNEAVQIKIKKEESILLVMKKSLHFYGLSGFAIKVQMYVWH